MRVSQSGGFIGKGRAGAIRRAKIKAQGGVTGESDIAILLKRGGYGSLIIEHKADKSSHVVSEKQQEYLDYHNIVAGNYAVSTRGVEAAKREITKYMELK